MNRHELVKLPNGKILNELSKTERCEALRLANNAGKRAGRAPNLEEALLHLAGGIDDVSGFLVSDREDEK